MKRQCINKPALLTSTLLFSLVAIPALANETGSPQANWREHMQQFDTDGDGQLSESERRALKAYRKEKVLEKFDADGDGQLNESERQAFKESRRTRMIEKFDADGDGQLNEQEKANAREAWSKLKDKRQEFRNGQHGVAADS